ncbi:hypothetical protein [uncultured Flavobacterium sp.]|uniref:hypothetical protein n=1 Tax=uncultured Flavobacterium sp. TaxID=165435 RepID=UPI0025FDE243|nr:hypothetical protein [uncultured Flavobacterium sp.]
MKKLFLFLLAVVTLNSCSEDDATTATSSFAMKAASADYDAQCNKPRVVISGDLTAANGPHNWTNNNVYVISGVVRVKTLLTIQEGTYIIAAANVTGANGVLVVTKAGTIDAQGEQDAPIVFTSWKLLDCNAATVPAPGDFGGVVLLGEGPVNTGSVTNVIEGLGDQPNVSDFYFGGNNATDASGTMSYVRIEYAGRELPAEGDNGIEINGLTFGAVGSGTIINHIQVSWGLDDAYEWFGGTVNATHLVAFSNDDDSFDFDWGYRGNISKAISIANKNSTHSGTTSVPDSNGIELDNNAGGVPGTPANLITRPVMTDLSIVGFKNEADAGVLENGIHVRRLGEISLLRATSTGYGEAGNAGLRWDVDPTLSAKSNLSIHGFDNIVLATTGTYSNFQMLGSLPNTNGTSVAPEWGVSPYQPFFNEPNFSLSGGTTGAFATEANWTASWTVFN